MLFIVVVIKLWLVSKADSSVVNDDVLFQLNWPGNELMLPENNGNILFMTTADNEQYQCLLPDEGSASSSEFIHYTGLSAKDLMQSLLDRHTCTIRIESYWNYELCHGQHIRQYHETKEQGSKTKLQEYFLGRGYIFPTEAKFEMQNATLIKDTRENVKVPTFLLEDREYPYFEVIMRNGTPCDLKDGVPRMTRVHYICDEGSRNEMIMQEESSTCEYRVVIATSLLCNHPLYKVKDAPINTINCHPVNGSPTKPDGLTQLESTNSRMVKVSDSTTPVTRQPQAHPASAVTSSTKGTPSQSSQTAQQGHPAHIEDEELAQQFLRGEHCLSGGKGWWKYEFCYKRFAQQYHMEKSSRTNVLLGTWDEDAHKKWWLSSKKTHIPGSKTITHFYSNGDICDITGKPRQVQVKLKCKENVSKSAVTLYLVEPSVCNYVLGVESSLLCPLFENADEYGLF
ncbi:Endoplasmic reticulum lectin 1 [Holothuria leucospilota]|uniref:Endoplasmic reticulum lectin 1 n=1 Tax=Holothuria leucospilota TaxID=206669 RepID=A0A9Q1CJT5_HOLLE|nr:Endoplasmic reticulum lectin 1 [Holothuria leucospilota]